MFIITNRKLHTRKQGLDQFGKTPNERGPNELRIVEATRNGAGWNVDVLDDTLSRAQKEALGLPVSKTAYASRYVAQKLLERVQDGKRNLLFFVHGFNNDIEAVLERAEGLEQRYGVEVVSFSWPANGGGVTGVPSYKSDKRDARASAGAVYRALEKARDYLDTFNAALMDDIRKKAAEKFPDNYERRNDYITRMADKGCPFKVSLLLHSMGNYLFKQIQRSSTYDGHHMLFDNVILAAADTNNADHASWVDRIACRRRIFVTINEDDSALRISRIKTGDEQRARLGHFPHRLDSREAFYVNVTEAPDVGSSHAYFEGEPVSKKSGNLFKFFNAAVNGERAEKYLEFHAPSNSWRP
ncbi:MAG: alpha/beta hydrolase [Gammaproteobacteria bacterium]